MTTIHVTTIWGTTTTGAEGVVENLEEAHVVHGRCRTVDFSDIQN